jgi:hypothetical protein
MCSSLNKEVQSASTANTLNLANINTRHFYLMQLKYEELHGMSWEIDNIAIECKTL